MTHPSHAHFLLSCEKGLLFGIFLSGGRLTTLQDFATQNHSSKESHYSLHRYKILLLLQKRNCCTSYAPVAHSYNTVNSLAPGENIIA